MITLAALSSPDFQVREAASAHTSRLVVGGESANIIPLFFDQMGPEAAERAVVAGRSYYLWRFGGERWPTLHAMRADCSEGSASWDSHFIREYGQCWQCYSEPVKAAAGSGMTQVFYQRKPFVLVLEKRVVERECERLLLEGKTRGEVAQIINEALSRPQRPSYLK